jgi:hypothetical protein
LFSHGLPLMQVLSSCAVFSIYILCNKNEALKIV